MPWRFTSRIAYTCKSCSSLPRLVEDVSYTDIVAQRGCPFDLSAVEEGLEADIGIGSSVGTIRLG